MIDFPAYGLTKNPFSAVPSQVTHWSGHDRQRQLLHDIYQSVLHGDSQVSEFVLIVGEWGSGKTHALEYFTGLVNYGEPEMRAKAILVPRVKLAPKISWLEIYRHVVAQHWGREFFEKLADGFDTLVTECADDLSYQVDHATRRELLRHNRNHFVDEVISTIPADTQPYARLLLAATSDADEQEETIRYLTEGSKLRTSINVPREIKNDYTAVQTLAGIFRVMTLPVMDKDPVYRAVHFAIDEAEELYEVKAAEQAEFWYCTRELINRVPERMAFLLAFSADTATLEALVSDAVYDRRTRKNVVLERFDPEDAREFVRRQLEHCRPDEYEPGQPFFPFTPGAIDYILEQTVSLVPRRIFWSCRQVLERSIRRYNLGKGEEIDRELAERIIYDMGI